jgi:hypothetical protein
VNPKESRTMEDSDEEILLTPYQVAEMLGRSVADVMRLISAGTLPCRNVGATGSPPCQISVLDVMKLNIRPRRQEKPPAPLRSSLGPPNPDRSF